MCIIYSPNIAKFKKSMNTNNKVIYLNIFDERTQIQQS